MIDGQRHQRIRNIGQLPEAPPLLVPLGTVSMTVRTPSLESRRLGGVPRIVTETSQIKGRLEVSLIGKWPCSPLLFVARVNTRDTCLQESSNYRSGPPEGPASTMAHSADLCIVTDMVPAWAPVH